MNANAIIQELAAQRMLMGDRAAQKASELADAQDEIGKLLTRIVELEAKLRERDGPIPP